MSVPFKSDPVDTVQRNCFQAVTLPTEHDCYLFHDLFQQLDTSSIESQYMGQHAYIRGTVGNYYSHQFPWKSVATKICMYIAGKNCPNFRVLSAQGYAAFFQDWNRQAGDGDEAGLPGACQS